MGERLREPVTHSLARRASCDSGSPTVQRWSGGEGMCRCGVPVLSRARRRWSVGRDRTLCCSQIPFELASPSRGRSGSRTRFRGQGQGRAPYIDQIDQPDSRRLFLFLLFVLDTQSLEMNVKLKEVFSPLGLAFVGVFLPRLWARISTTTDQPMGHRHC